MTPIARDLADLPRVDPVASHGAPPDRAPRFIQVLAESWQAADIAAGDKPLATATARFRHSDAGKCARLLGYKAAGIPVSDPMDLSGVNNVNLGTLLHDAWQAALRSRYTAEVEVTGVSLDGDGACHVDAVIVAGDRTIAYELKTIGGYGFKSAIGKAQRGRAAEGPKREHVLQGALNAVAVNADELVIGYLAKEAVSVNASSGLSPVDRFAAEWTYTRPQFQPLADREAARVRAILDLADKSVLAARKIPDLGVDAEIVDPATGRWERCSPEGLVLDTGSYWGCGYCSHRTLCASTPKGRITVDSIDWQVDE